MPSALVMTSAWWLDAPPSAAWPLIADAGAWPGWWRGIATLRAAAPARPLSPVGLLRGLWWPWRLRLCVRRLQAQAPEWAEWQVQGDLQARLIWMLSDVHPGGSDLTCRWEFALPPQRSPLLHALARTLAERSHFARMRACARDMGLALGCRVGRLREWSGSTRR